VSSCRTHQNADRDGAGVRRISGHRAVAASDHHITLTRYDVGTLLAAEKFRGGEAWRVWEIPGCGRGRNFLLDAASPSVRGYISSTYKDAFEFNCHSRGFWLHFITGLFAAVLWKRV